MNRPTAIRTLVSASVTVALMQAGAHAAMNDGDTVGRVVVASGKVIARMDDTDPRPLKRRSPVREGETVITGEKARTQLRFEDGAVIALDSNSRLVIEDYRYQEEDSEDRAVVRLITGGLRTLSGQVAEESPENYQLETPLASIGVRGTDYELAITEGELSVAVWSGRVVLRNDAGTLPLGRNANYRYAVVKDRGLSPKGLLTPPEPMESRSRAVKKPTKSRSGGSKHSRKGPPKRRPGPAPVSDRERERPRLSDDADVLQSRRDLRDDRDAFDSGPREAPDEDHDRTEPWIPGTIAQVTLGASETDIEIENERDRIFTTLSTVLDPEARQFVALAPGNQFISLEGTGLNRFQRHVGGYPVNWGAWNGQPDMLLHEDEFDEAGTARPAPATPLFLASAPPTPLATLREERVQSATINFTGVVDAVGQIRDANVGFNTALDDPSVSAASSFMNLDLETGELSGVIDVAKDGGDFSWNAQFRGRMEPRGVTFAELLELNYNGTFVNPSETPSAVNGLITKNDQTDTFGFLSNFHLTTGDDSASATGILLLEEAR